jgi:hypothetical protein
MNTKTKSALRSTCSRRAKRSKPVCLTRPAEAPVAAPAPAEAVEVTPAWKLRRPSRHRWSSRAGRRGAGPAEKPKAPPSLRPSPPLPAKAAPKAVKAPAKAAKPAEAAAPVEAAPAPAATPAPVVAKKVVKPAKPKPVKAEKVEKAEKPAKQPKAKAEKPAKVVREKVVRDSFSMPKSEHAQLKALRETLAKAGRICTKSELLRAGMQLLLKESTASTKALVEAWWWCRRARAPSKPALDCSKRQQWTIHCCRFCQRASSTTSRTRTSPRRPLPTKIASARCRSSGGAGFLRPAFPQQAAAQHAVEQAGAGGG